MIVCMDEETLATKIRETDWLKEAEEAKARYNATPRWRVFRRRVHREAWNSAVWFLGLQEVGAL